MCLGRQIEHADELQGADDSQSQRIAVLTVLDALGGQEDSQQEQKVVDDGGADDPVVVPGANVRLVDIHKVQAIENDGQNGQVRRELVLGIEHTVSLHVHSVQIHATASFPSAIRASSAFISWTFQMAL